jgi:hypothetical protein
MAAARITRQLAALGALMLAIRFAWLSGGEALRHLYTRLSPGEAEMGSSEATPDESNPTRSPLTNLAEGVNHPDNPHRPDLKQLNEKFQTAPDVDTLKSDPSPAPIRARRLLVDVGPERSEVYVQGRLVGHTPYVGQVSCAEGQPIKIDILPPEGAPAVRSAVCRGDTILANQ